MTNEEKKPSYSRKDVEASRIFAEVNQRLAELQQEKERSLLEGLIKEWLKPFPAPSSLIDDFLNVFDGVDVNTALDRLADNIGFRQNAILPGPAWELINDLFLERLYNQDDETVLSASDFYKEKISKPNIYLAIKDMRKVPLDVSFDGLYPELKRRVRGWIYNDLTGTTEKKYRLRLEREIPIPEEDPETGLTDIELEINRQLSEYPWVGALYFSKVAIYGAVKRLPEKEKIAWLIKYAEDLVAYLDEEIFADEAHYFMELTDEEVAKRYKVKVSTVRKWRQRAIEKIRDYLSAKYPDGLDYLDD